jgi:hypothetical protein
MSILAQEQYEGALRSLARKAKDLGFQIVPTPLQAVP